jgi:hypothetical protein
VTDQWQLDAEFIPLADRSVADSQHNEWLRAVERSRS